MYGLISQSVTALSRAVAVFTRQTPIRSAVRIIKISGFEEHTFQYYPLSKFRQGILNTLGIESKIHQWRPGFRNQLFPENHFPHMGISSKTLGQKLQFY